MSSEGGPVPSGTLRYSAAIPIAAVEPDLGNGSLGYCFERGTSMVSVLPSLEPNQNRTTAANSSLRDVPEAQHTREE